MVNVNLMHCIAVSFPSSTKCSDHSSGSSSVDYSSSEKKSIWIPRKLRNQKRKNENGKFGTAFVTEHRLTTHDTSMAMAMATDPNGRNAQFYKSIKKRQKRQRRVGDVTHWDSLIWIYIPQQHELNEHRPQRSGSDSNVVCVGLVCVFRSSEIIPKQQANGYWMASRR